MCADWQHVSGESNACLTGGEPRLRGSPYVSRRMFAELSCLDEKAVGYLVRSVEGFRLDLKILQRELEFVPQECQRLVRLSFSDEVEGHEGVGNARLSAKEGQILDHSQPGEGGDYGSYGRAGGKHEQKGEV
jgi:hypothetical protein